MAPMENTNRENKKIHHCGLCLLFAEPVTFLKVPKIDITLFYYFD